MQEESERRLLLFSLVKDLAPSVVRQDVVFQISGFGEPCVVYRADLNLRKRGKADERQK